MAKSPEEMAATMIANIRDKTGKTLPDWLKIIRKESLDKHGQIVKFLKSEHGVTHGYANLVASQALAVGQSAPEAGDLVLAQYGGAKEGLRPIYESIIQAVKKFGTDVEISPKKAYVSLRRNKQFAIIQPSTKTRVDVGINLSDHEPTPRLELSGSFNAMVSHRVRLATESDVDRALIGWLKKAYAES